MAVIAALVFATAAGFATIAAATILVIIGVRQEERHQTITRERPPAIPALLARRVLGVYVCQLRPDRPGPDSPARERPGNLRSRRVNRGK